MQTKLPPLVGLFHGLVDEIVAKYLMDNDESCYLSLFGNKKKIFLSFVVYQKIFFETIKFCEPRFDPPRVSERFYFYSNFSLCLFAKTQNKLRKWK